MRAKKIAAILLAGMMLGTMTLGGCGKINGDAVAVTVNDTEVSLGFANFVVKYQQAVSDQYYVSYFGEDVWQQDSPSEEGKTMGEVQKDMVLEQLEDWYLLEQNREAYQVEVSEEEQEKITDTAKSFMEANSDEAIKQVGATQEYVEQMLYFKLLEEKMQEAVGEQAEITVTDEDAAERTFSYIAFEKPGSTEDGSTESSGEEESSVDTEEQIAQIEAYAQQAKEDFDAVAEGQENSGTYSYAKDDTLMDESVIAAADELEEGEISDLIEGEQSYFIIRLDSEYDEEASVSHKEELIQNQKNEYYTEILQGWHDEAKLELNKKQWSRIELRDLFEIVSEEQ